MRIQLTFRVRSQLQTRAWQTLRIRCKVRLSQSRLGNIFNKKYENSANIKSSVAVADQGMANPEDSVQDQVSLGQAVHLMKKYENLANITSSLAVADQGMAKPKDLVQSQIKLVQVRPILKNIGLFPMSTSCNNFLIDLSHSLG